MAKGLRFTMYAALIFLTYLWISTVYQSCTATEVKVETGDINNEYDEELYGTDEFEDDFFEEDEEIDEMGGETTSTDEETDEEESIDYTEVDEIIERNKTPDSKKNVESTKKNNSKPEVNNTISSGKYLLLAGHYLLERNAKNMVKKLKKQGYPNAEVVIFDMSPYYSVCAGRYMGLTKAQQASAKLKRKGVDNYVHTKQ